MAGDAVFAGSLVGRYDAVLGPFMFEPFARVTAERLAGVSGDVLEIAAGTGIVTRELDRALASDATLMATDLNRPMLDRAAERLNSPRVSWRQADALALPFEDASFDAVVCQFGVMFYPDQVAGHREAFRVLRPDGRYVLGVWDDLASNPVAGVVHQTAARLFLDNPADFLGRTPHGHYETRRLRAHLEAAGFHDIAIDTVTLDAARLTAQELAVGFCEGTPLRHELEQRSPTGIADASQAVEQALRTRFGDGPIASTIQAHVIVAER